MRFAEWTRMFSSPPPSVPELAERMIDLLSFGETPTRLVALLTSRHYSGRPPYDRASDLAIRTLLEEAWRRGWQPMDVWQLARRRTDKRLAEFTIGALAVEATQYAEAALDPRWRAQLRQLGANPWWDRSEPYVAAWRRRHAQDELAMLELVFRLLMLLRRLPSLPVLLPLPGTVASPITESAESVDPKLLAKVRALLAKAESTPFPEEADAFFAKAQELMSRHSLERGALNATNHGVGQEPPTIRAEGRRIWLDKPYPRPKSMLVSAVARANRCRTVIDRLGFVTVIGEETDIEIVEVLATSLLVQAGKAMLAAGHREDWGGISRTKSFRYSFLVSYATRIDQRLRAASARAEAEVARELGDGRLLPVLAARERAVDERVRQLYPRLASGRRIAATNYEGWVAGRVAADQAVLTAHRAIRVADPNS